MKKVCIVIPVYKQRLNLFEKISLQQVLRTLGHYPIYLVCPDTVEIQYEELSGYQYDICQFDEKFFQNTATYSEMMLSPFFYERFLEYEYMLVYQLDCFVFFDGLSDFCDMDYDYIGAPQYHSWTNDIVVGNGGLSLRKISSVLNVVKKYDEIVQEPYYRDYFRKWEDNFFSYCGGKREVEFKVPEISLADSFSTVRDVENGIQNISVKGLPFGTHAWHRMYFDFWKDIIKAYGYPTERLIPKETTHSLEADQDTRRRNYFWGVIPGFASDKKEEIVKELGFSPDKKYVMWGAGDFGAKSLKVLLDLGMNIGEIFDSNPKKNRLYGLSVTRPDYQKILEQNVTVLIGSELYDKEIEQELLEHGCEEFINLSHLFQTKLKFLQDEYLKTIPDIEGITKPFHFMEDKSWISEIVERAQIKNLLHKNGICDEKIKSLDEFRSEAGLFYCNICKSKILAWKYIGQDCEIFRYKSIAGGGKRRGGCAVCRSNDRARFVYYVMEHYTELLKGNADSILHFAPEHAISEKLKALYGRRYISADISPGRADVVADITKLQFEDEQFSYIICNHVMEHISDEQKAFSELRRCLRADGILIFTAPICWEQQTYEDDSIITKADRVRYYGQEDHVRLYGKDIEERIESFGFHVNILKCSEIQDENSIKRFGFLKEDSVLLCKKKLS